MFYMSGDIVCRGTISLSELSSLALPPLYIVVLSQPQPLLSGIFLVAFLTDRLEVHLEELCFGAQPFITGRTGEVVAAPGLAESCEDVALHHSDFCTDTDLLSQNNTHYSL